jgi:alpha-mannosidase
MQNISNPQKIKVAEINPVYTKVQVVYKFNKSTISQDIVLYNDIPRIDFKTNIDWQEIGSGKTNVPMLKVSFPTTLISDKACYEIPYGTINRPVDGNEYPAQKWAELTDMSGEHGFALLNDMKHGYSVQGNTIKLTLLRNAYEPDLESDTGKHKFTYSVYPHAGTWQDSGTMNKGYELNVPLVTVVSNNKTAGDLPETNSFITVDKKNVLVSTLKKHEYSNELVLRLYETEGIQTEVNIKFNLGNNGLKYKEIDLEERNDYTAEQLVANGLITVRFKPTEIKTLIIY